jgi:hypothetical protein
MKYWNALASIVLVTSLGGISDAVDAAECPKGKIKIPREPG